MVVLESGASVTERLTIFIGFKYKDMNTSR